MDLSISSRASISDKENHQTNKIQSFITEASIKRLEKFKTMFCAPGSTTSAGSSSEVNPLSVPQT